MKVSPAHQLLLIFHLVLSLPGQLIFSLQRRLSLSLQTGRLLLHPPPLFLQYPCPLKLLSQIWTIHKINHKGAAVTQLYSIAYLQACTMVVNHSNMHWNISNKTIQENMYYFIKEIRYVVKFSYLFQPFWSALQTGEASSSSPASLSPPYPFLSLLPPFSFSHSLAGIWEENR